MASKELIAVLSGLLEGLPDVSAKMSAGHASFVVGKKVFAYTRDEGVVVKLPKSRVAGLVARQYASRLVMGKRSMAEWAVIEHEETETFREDEALLREAHDFVAGKGGRA